MKRSEEEKNTRKQCNAMLCSRQIMLELCILDSYLLGFYVKYQPNTEKPLLVLVHRIFEKESYLML